MSDVRYESGFAGYAAPGGGPPAGGRGEAGGEELPFWRRPILTPRVTHLDVALFATQLRAMVGAGIPVNEALGLVARASRHHAPALSDALEAVRRDVEDGKTLAAGFRAQERVFGRLCVEMIATGEATGTLERSLGDVAEDCEYRHQSRASLLSAFVEPVVIVVLGVAVSYLLLTVTVPQFKTLYASLTRTGMLPLPTRALIATSDALLSPAGIAAMAAIAILGVAVPLAVARSERLRFAFDRRLLSVPLVGELALLDAVARASRTIGVVYRSVGEIPLGLELARTTTSNLFVAESVARVADDVYDGRMVWEAMRDARVFPEIAVSMTKSGEETGRLDTMLFKLAETLETRVRYRRERLLAVLRYTLLLAMGGLVLGLMLALYLPIFSLIDQLRR